MTVLRVWMPSIGKKKKQKQKQTKKNIHTEVWRLTVNKPWALKSFLCKNRKKKHLNIKNTLVTIGSCKILKRQSK